MKSLLIANRGEIACRIIRTAQAMGIRTVAVYSDADAKALHVQQADEAVHIGPSPVAESYLLGEKIIAAAKETDAQAIHPGYGFLSENADFAQAVIDAGLTWVGPKPESIRAMGLKDSAKTLMDKAGVPTTPGYLGENQDPDFLAKQARKIGYPVLIKAVAGGGGKGMRKVDKAGKFGDALISCQREAKASFGNDIVLIENWIESPRHIEVQVFGDSHGNVVHLFERDCSLQRRHQKVIEEAPAPGMDEKTRDAVCAAAVRAAAAVDYEGAGTIEFIADASEGLNADKIWFMEMNTRLQVEHPVTEEITGVDLVEWQLRVASGEPIPITQDKLSIKGHAIEARLYAEDPAKGFLPSTGKLDACFLPHDIARVETAVEKGLEVSPFYDPMIAKIITTGADRYAAIDALLKALSETAVWPVQSNAGFLYKAAGHDAFRRAELTTSFIPDHDEALAVLDEPNSAMLEEAGKSILERYGHSRTSELQGFRLNQERNRKVRLACDGQINDVSIADEICSDIRSTGLNPETVLITQEGQSFAIGLPRTEAGVMGLGGDGAILAPMPGSLISVNVAQGDHVNKGQKLLTLEAMKMEHTLAAPFDGVVTELAAKAGEQIQVDTLLVKIEAEKT